MVTWKAIKPQPVRQKQFDGEFLAAGRHIETKIRRDFKKTVETWEHQPEWVSGAVLKRNIMTIFVWTDDQIYGYVNYGTEEHDIDPKNKNSLAFLSGYSAKTKPGRISSSSGGPFGDFVLAGHVDHPGSRARDFEGALRRSWEKRFVREMGAALQRARVKSGHAA